MLIPDCKLPVRLKLFVKASVVGSGVSAASGETCSVLVGAYRSPSYNLFLCALALSWIRFAGGFV